MDYNDVYRDDMIKALNKKAKDRPGTELRLR